MDIDNNRAGTLVRETSRLTRLAVMVALATGIHALEAALPLPMPVPGARLGLANIITLLALSLFGFKSGLLIAVLRVVLGSLLTGSFLGFGFWLSLLGGTVSCLIMAAAVRQVKRGIMTLISASVLGAVTHNLAQLFVASLIVKNFTLFQGYFPLSVLLALPTGLFTGAAAHYLEGIIRRFFKQTASRGGL
ncbi:MAG TPA: Gx transporter family protein [Firmicutes bacterium]|nr:Gx transporter family protein [Bacillota bacterium]